MVSDPKPELFLARQTPGPDGPVPLDLSLPGQNVALIGGKGSGKSTLLRHLSLQPNVITLDDTTPEAAAETAQANPDARVFASAGGPIPGFTSQELLPLGNWDIFDYIEHHTAEADVIRGRLRQGDDFYELLRTPATLAEFVRMVNRGLVFPEQRVELYDWLGINPHSTDFPVLAVRMFKEGGAEKVDGLFGLILDSCDETLASRAAMAAFLYAAYTNLLPYGYRVGNPRYRTLVLGMTELFEDTPEAAAVPLVDKVGAAEALGLLGDPRLRLPSDPDYWAPVGPNLQLGRFPVTVHEFTLYVEATGYIPYKWSDQLNHPSRPVTGVSWHRAVAYCRWAGGHLPTDTEWESALAGKYPWGDEEPGDLHTNSIWLQLFRPTPVGLFPRGNTPQTGIADLYGNVWELVDKDATLPGEIEMKAVRGASTDCFIADPKGRLDTGDRGHENIGFRCAK